MCSQTLLVLSAIFLSFNLCFSSRHGFWSYRLDKQHYKETVSVEDFGATPDDRDNSDAFEKAWNATCSQGLTLVVPENKIYYLKQTTFYGPCQSNTTFKIYGTMKAWGDMSVYEEDRRHWIVFNGVEQLRVEGGGTIDGNGQIWWQHSCKVNASLPCKEGPTAVTFLECNKLRVKNLNLKDAQQMHLSFQKCFDVEASHLKVVAPEDSPNTDGIHITETVMIRIAHSEIGTGDDCISIVSGSRNVTATNITCGPGHGISIGSLGAHHSEDMVSNVEVNGAIFTASTNGARIKTWQGGSGYAKNIMFESIEMHNVSHPIIIDQNYCDQKEPCQEEDSAVAVSNILYKNIGGTSASELAINFNCSKTVPCKAISLQNVDLKPEGNENGRTNASCENVRFGNAIEFNPQCSSD